MTEQKLIGFVAYAVNQGLKHQTVKCYLSVVRHLQVECGVGDPRVESMPLLALVLRGACFSGRVFSYTHLMSTTQLDRSHSPTMPCILLVYIPIYYIYIYI